MKKVIRQNLKDTVKILMTTRLGRQLIDFVAMARKSHLNGQVSRQLLENEFADGLVMNGPFKDMKFPQQDWPKMLGSYEDELHGVVEHLCRQQYEQIIDIGAAEGYYAVGFAMRNPRVRVFAYELDLMRQKVCDAMAKLNGVDRRLEIRGKCEPTDLAGVDYTKRTLIFCDCDGYELPLLDLKAVPGLMKADILVEVHDCFNPRISRALRERFEPTHELTVFREQRKDHNRYPQLRGLLPLEVEVCLNEDRISADIPFAMEWFHLVAKSR